MRVVTIDEMKEIEDLAFNDYGLSEATIIENVGIRSFDYLKKHYRPSEVLFLVGKGNNGADAMAMARHCFNSGLKVRTFLLFAEESCSVELQKQIVLARNFGVPIVEDVDSTIISSTLCTLRDSTVLIDGILGTGFMPPLEDWMRAIFEVINSYPQKTISLDIPSGVTGESGIVDQVAIKADVTLAIQLPKRGHIVFDGKRFTGKLEVLDVGFPAMTLNAGPNDMELLTKESLQLPQIPEEVHKNDLGHLLVVGGSLGYSGAPIIASTAALKSGVGLVSAITWNESYAEMVSRMRPEIMCSKISSFNHIEKYNSVLLGPGLGLSQDSENLVKHLLDLYPGNLVLDADALTILSKENRIELLSSRKAKNVVLTPHIGEFARLLNIDPEIIMEATIDYAQDFARTHKVYLVLKDSTSIIACPNGKVYISHYPNRGMATAGSGDVLAGTIGGLLAKRDRANQKITDALIQGVLMHSFAGKMAAEKLSKSYMSSMDIIDCYSHIFKELE